METYLYKRPQHFLLRIIANDPDTNTQILKGEQAISAFAGIDIAVRGVSMNNGQLADSLRIIRKLEKASHRETSLHDLYVEFTAQERKIIEASVIGFDWSKFCAQNNTNLWINWIEFLEGFIEGTDTNKATWTVFDPKNPSEDYASWKLAHAELIESYNAEVKAAELRAAAKAAEAKTAEAQAPKTDTSVVEGDFTPAT
jgi:hypothetical protein